MKRTIAGVENGLVCAALVSMTILPLAEVVLRRWFGIGIKGSTAIVQHLCLVVSMVGGVIAARNNRLLTLSNLGGRLTGRLQKAAQLATAGIAFAITAGLAIASAQFVRAEKEAAQILVYDIPVWWIQLVMPVGFAMIAIYTILDSEGLARRAAVTAIGLGLIFATAGSETPQAFVLPMLAALVLATLIGVPVFVTLGGIALILFWGLQQPIASIAVDHYSLVTDPSLPTIPLFTLAGYVLAESKAPQRLVRVFRSLLGNFAGSSVVATVVVCAFFTTFTGASGITILALGGLLMPILLSDGYRERRALGLVTSAGSLGLLFPPCLPLILYAIIAKVPLEQMFLGGLLPGTIMALATAFWGFRTRERGHEEGAPFTRSEALAAAWDAKWELALPIVALGSMFSGLATPVEAAALTALYALIVEVLINRDLSPGKDLVRVMTECGLLVGGVLLILGVALGLTNYLVYVDFTLRAIDWITATIQSPLVFLLVLNIWLLIVGCLMDIYSAIVIQVPLLVPLALRFNIDPIHLGVIFLANLEVGYLTPPVGLNLFMSSFRFQKPLPEVTRATFPVALVLLAAVIIITYLPFLSTALPNHFTP
ncbi:MAG: TRAP transporter large permease subunit [Acidobacteria bacterium]|nr:TRAP transporter large permease subunit [Acidobacteriota bacterium]